MFYLYKKPTQRSEYGKSSITEVNEVVIPQEKFEKVDTKAVSAEPRAIGSQGSSCFTHITEINYEEHLKNLELMCKADRSFMARVRSFCEEHKEDNFPNVVESLQHPEPASQYEERSE
ncbi:MAG: hypothetical protein EBR30_23125 [Cytophagia bacterium]|nr:hypothetical protein [Cytophagia bacterium]NBW37856.1 hypothetical protein [Cytophagia bacterium]